MTNFQQQIENYRKKKTIILKKCLCGSNLFGQQYMKYKIVFGI